MNPDDFPAVVQAIHRHPPFAWQRRLLREVVACGWPDTLAVPTGCGKTAALDVALFHVATAPPGSAPRRIVMCVDRRVVVDQAYERATRIRDALDNAASGTLLASFRDALCRRAGGAAPLHVEVLRGGMPREDDWARTPAQPTILCTTVDQLGSRLLFRGYGVSDSMAPVHAGLLGEDALLLLDEAHLSAAFMQTLRDVARHRARRSADGELGLRWQVCMLTATPGRAVEAGLAETDSAQPKSRFELTGAEKAELAARLTRPKPAKLRVAAARAKDDEYAAAFAETAKELAGTASVVAIVVNRVALARAVFGQIGEGCDKLLLTGRVRPVERDRLIEENRHRLMAGRDRASARGPLIVVATQCIEAGADFDFDAMVTQIAPLDALRQRFGRLNRLGELAATTAVILSAKDEVNPKTPDPVYGEAPAKTWAWLVAQAAAGGPVGAAQAPAVAAAARRGGKRHRSAASGEPPLAGDPELTLDMSAAAVQSLIDADAKAALACLSDSADAPVLRPADVAFFATTNPPPDPDPYLPLFLHGRIDSETDVSLIWRADLRPDADKSAAEAIIDARPPLPGEALQVPIRVARLWLAGKAGADIADVEGAPDPGGEVSHDGRVFRWRGGGEAGWIDGAALRPGDLLVLPAKAGGCDHYGWNPASADAVADIADLAAEPYHERELILRLHPDLWRAESARQPKRAPTEAPAAGEDITLWATAWPVLLDAVRSRRLPAEVAVTDGGAAEAPRRIVCMPEAVARLWRLIAERDAPLERSYPYGETSDGEPIGIVVRVGRAHRDGGSGAATRQRGGAARLGVAATADDRGSTAADVPVALAEHQKAVEAMAERLMAPLCLPEPVHGAVLFAAAHHDDGKADDRFQAWIGGSVAAPLAKSGRWRGAAAEMEARVRAGVPTLWRHEVLSVRHAAALLRDEAGAGFDAELALFLIGSHHGQGRPFFLHDDPWDAAERELLGRTLGAGAGPNRLDFDWNGLDWPGLFAVLRARYGAWGLAYCEALLRLADHRASEGEA
jgi:CRISPR-associated endonuclease/helicase Cas3